MTNETNDVTSADAGADTPLDETAAATPVVGGDPLDETADGDATAGGAAGDGADSTLPCSTTPPR